MDEASSAVPAADLIALARLNGLVLTEAEVEALRPAYAMQQRCLAALRRAVAGEAEPATIFVAAEAAIAETAPGGAPGGGERA